MENGQANNSCKHGTSHLVDCDMCVEESLKAKQLTKDRMTIATAAMQALIGMAEKGDTYEDLADISVKFADALLEELNK